MFVTFHAWKRPRATAAFVLLRLQGDLSNITKGETYTQIHTPVSQSGRHRAVPLHALFGFQGLVLNVDGSVPVTCSVGDPAKIRLAALSSSHVFMRAERSKKQILHLGWLLSLSLLSVDG